MSFVCNLSIGRRTLNAACLIFTEHLISENSLHHQHFDTSIISRESLNCSHFKKPMSLSTALMQPFIFSSDLQMSDFQEFWLPQYFHAACFSHSSHMLSPSILNHSISKSMIISYSQFRRWEKF